jgi:hypothetical protein
MTGSANAPPFPRVHEKDVFLAASSLSVFVVIGRATTKTLRLEGSKRRLRSSPSCAWGAPACMKMMHIFEILRVLGVLEVRQQANLQGSKASKVLKELFSKQ